MGEPMTQPPDPSSEPASLVTSTVTPPAVPASPAPGPQGNRRLLAQRPGWKLSLLLGGLLLYVLIQTFTSSSRTEHGEISDRMEQTLEAVKETKLAFIDSRLHYFPAAPVAQVTSD